MASEIRVNKIRNRSGLGTVTFADTGVDLAGIVTATTFSGSGASLTSLPAAQVTGTLPAISGANLTNLPAANLTGSLPAISGANLTGIAATDNVRTGILDVAGVSTFRNTMNVGAAVTISESGIEASGIGITVANINGGAIGGRRNIIINGAMMVAQRGTSSTSSNMQTVDRFEYRFGGTDEAPTQSQADVASGTTPYTLGFRKSYKIQNGNQTSGAGAGDNIYLRTRLEAQDIANSGWNYTSSSSFITLSFWIKSSVAQNFYGYVRSVDGTAQNYPFETGSLSADTWTKVIKTIPGNSNLQFDNDVNNGLNLVVVAPFWGTDYTASSVTLNQWAAYASGTRTPDNTSTWYTTNDATLEITGVQLEVGSQATAFEHRNFGEELSLCQRYYYAAFPLNSAGKAIAVVGEYAVGFNFSVIQFPCTMRTVPTGDLANGSTYVKLFNPLDTSGRGCASVTVGEATPNSSRLFYSSFSSNFSSTTGSGGYSYVESNSFKLCFQAEL